MEVVNGDFLGGGIMLAVAAVLWIIYLVPALWRRHNFDATERNAVRLNQTLRALVETSEAPQELRLEATARAVAEQRRALKKAEARARHHVRTATLNALAPEFAAARGRAHLTSERRTAVLLLLVSLGVTGWGVFAFFSSGQWGFAMGGMVGIFSAVLLLRNSARKKTTQAPVVRPDSIPRRRIPVAPTVDQTGWRPAQVPAPLTSRQGSLARSTVDAQQVRDQLRRNAAIDAAASKAKVAEQVAPAAASARVAGDVSRERLAAMGVVGETGDVALDLTDALRRRRTGS